MGGTETNKRTENKKPTTDSYSTSQRRCVIEGKRFLVTRNFEGDKDLSALMMEIAVLRANRETGFVIVRENQSFQV